MMPSVLRTFVAILMMASASVSAHAERLLYETDWHDGIDPHLIVQANPGDMTVVKDGIFQGSAVLLAKMARSENFSKIANGTPRAELLLPVRFAQGHTYRIRWSTRLPVGTRFDTQQFLIVTQIHQGPKTGGSPPVALAMQDSQYGITQRGGGRPRIASAGRWLCCAADDVGKWVNWDLRYRPSDSGEDALTELRRDGILVFRASERPNAYPGDQQAYLKLGLYKPDWKIKETDAPAVSMMYGPVRISEE